MKNKKYNFFNNKQNEEYMIKLLSLQKCTYTKAKIINSVPWFLTAILIFIKVCKFNIIDLSFIFSFITISLERIRNKFIYKAATIQENFDINLFQIPWNNILLGDEPDYSQKKYSQKKLVDLKNWYEIPENEENNNKIISNFQKQNLKYDMNLNLILLICLILFFCISFYICQTFLNYTWSDILFVFSPLIIKVISYLFNLIDLYISENKLNEIINTLEKKGCSENELRQVQDYIFVNIRCNKILVPNFIYKSYKFFLNKFYI